MHGKAFVAACLCCAMLIVGCCPRRPEPRDDEFYFSYLLGGGAEALPDGFEGVDMAATTGAIDATMYADAYVIPAAIAEEIVRLCDDSGFFGWQWEAHGWDDVVEHQLVVRTASRENYVTCLTEEMLAADLALRLDPEYFDYDDPEGAAMAADERAHLQRWLAAR